MTNLTRAEITDRIEALRPSLTTMQAARLTTLRDLVGTDGRFLLRQALVDGEFPEGDARAQDAFREFRTKVNAIARGAGVDLVLELESRKSSPDTRHGWFSGNPVERSLVAFTEDAAEKIGIVRPVTPEVAELGESRRLRVHVSFHPTTGNLARSAFALIEQLTNALQALDGQTWEVTDSSTVGIGADTEEARARLCAEADVCVSLISSAYLKTAERRLAFSRPDRLVAVAFSGLPHGSIDLNPLQRHEIASLDSPWHDLRGGQRTKYVNELLREIQRVISAPRAGSGFDDETAILKALLTGQLRSRRSDDSPHLVTSNVWETALQESLLEHGDQRSTGAPLRAVDRLVSWATDEKPNAPRLCALLGDVGMGKTTTAKLFTSRLLELHENDPSSPLPILFDLRDVRVGELTGAMALDRILDTMLDATRPRGVPRDRLNADVVRKQLETGHTVIVFDGLDEVLVHLSPHDRQLFTRQLWRALPADAAARMLLTCRTQYFRTIRDEADFFNGQTRQGLRGNDYLALLMLPFREEQIREYLAGNLGRDDSWVDGFLETIGAVHNLTELAQRPITLRLISDQVEFIETAKLEGRTLRSVDIYSEVVDRWISRDEGKHTLTPDHKRLLMEEIAAGLWRSGKNSWSPAEVDNWLLAVLDERPDIRRHYREHVPDLWTADFRTATFLKREGDSFSFAHRSLFEYFLARYLFRHLSSQDDRRFDALALAVPSKETLDFLGQSIAAAPSSAVATLEGIAGQYRPRASELALAYALHAASDRYPRQSLVGIDLTGAWLPGWQFAEEHRLAMGRANLSGANLRDASFVNVDLSGADFSNAEADNSEFHDCSLTQSSWNNASAVGAILRHCDTSEIDISQAKTHRTQFLSCSSPPPPSPGLLIAPNLAARPDHGARMSYFAGYIGQVHATAWSPDGARVLIGSFNSTQIMDDATGHLLHNLVDTDNIHGVAWSPDSTRILTRNAKGFTRIWDARTGRQVRQLTAAASGSVIGWSPDNRRVLTGDDDVVLVWDAFSGVQLRKLVDAATVRVATWSPDNTRILTRNAADQGCIWDAETGERIRSFIVTGPSNAAAWSCDSTRIAMGTSSCTRILDAATGDRIRDLTGSDFEDLQSVAWSFDNTRILTSNSAGAHIWNLATGEQIQKFPNMGEPVVWSPDNTRILAGGTLTGAHTWDAATGEQLHQLNNFNLWVRSVEWSSDNTRILSNNTLGDTYVWDATTGEKIHRFANPGSWWRAVAWSPDNTRMVTSNDDQGTTIWDTTTGTQLRKLTDSGAIDAVAWSADNTRILASNSSGTYVLDTTTGERLRKLTDESVYTVTWSSDNTRILTSTYGGGTCMWDATTGERLHELINTGDAAALAWSPDNTRILTNNSDGTNVWDATTAEKLHHFADDFGSAYAVAWSQDSTRVVMGTPSGAHVWDATGALLFQLGENLGGVYTVAWSPDNTRIATGNDNGVLVWDAITGDLVGPCIAILPESEYALFQGPQREVVQCSEGAWRWMGWTVAGEQGVDRLPAETFGPLPVVPQ